MRARRRGRRLRESEPAPRTPGGSGAQEQTARYLATPTQRRVFHAACETILAQARYGSGHPEPAPRFVAVKAMLWVGAHVSRETYGGLAMQKLPLPDTTGEALEMGAGICGHQAQILADLLRWLGIPARQVGFLIEGGADDSHVAVEAFWDDAWHYLDPTWGAFWERDGNILSIEEIESEPRRDELAVRNEPDLVVAAYVRAGLNPFEYLEKTRERFLLNWGETASGELELA